MQKATLQILPCTVSQLLSASLDHSGAFAIGDLELNQVSLVGIVRKSSPCSTYNQYSVDDMTGPPLTVRQWVNADDASDQLELQPGVYVKVHGSLRVFQGKKSLLAMNIHCLKDLNEITSHMLEVVYAHKQLFGKGCDVNMNALPVSDAPQTSSEEYMARGMSTIQGQVLHVISQHSVKQDGISFQDLTTLLDYIGIQEIRKSLAFLINEGRVFSSMDENHFKSTH
ncbi:replication protein A 32 kDa subunit-like isoform X2 [Periophthalmus magnuspinnatus]|uniref:replication protein A 32 kDa subunit-like isoform X2 n=1 Tax=Periophthalmus magnuspinnatus TaxID=409849 RepID=UPI0024366644|nr:replication protein A 32 kDa subunit-like isoform X2 [Periophthalmus magnuspinnatus]